MATITHKPSSAADANYEGLSVGDVEVIVVEDDRVGVTVRIGSLNIPDGESEELTVVLDSQPTANVTVTWVVDGGLISFDFTPQNWHRPQAGYILAYEDRDTIDRNHSIRFRPVVGGNYDGVSVREQIIRRVDNDPVMRYSLAEVEPVEEDVGTVRVGIQGVTNEDGVPRIDYRLTLAALEDTAEADRDLRGSAGDTQFPGGRL